MTTITSITDLSDLVNLLSGGGSASPQHIPFWKDNRVGSVAGTSFSIGDFMSMWTLNGNPGGPSAALAAAAAVVPTAATAGGLLQTNPGGGRQLWLCGIEALASAPGALVLYDRLLHVGGFDATVTNPFAVQGNANSGTCTITNASPAVVSFTGHGFGIGQKVRFTVSGGGSLPTGLSLLTDYFVISAGYATNSFEVSASYGGAAVNTSSAGSGTFTVTGQGPTPALTRYTDGVGVEAWVEIYTAIGATATTCTMTYQNTAGTTGQSSQTVAIGGSTSELNSAQRLIPIALASGDTGIESVDKIKLAATTVTPGNWGVTIAKRLGICPIPSGAMAGVRDFIAGLPSLPEVKTNACLALAYLMSVGSSSPSVQGIVHLVEK